MIQTLEKTWGEGWEWSCCNLLAPRERERDIDMDNERYRGEDYSVLLRMLYMYTVCVCVNLCNIERFGEHLQGQTAIVHNHTVNEILQSAI